MSRSPLEYLRHMRDETEYLSKEKVGLSQEQFLQDATLKRAFVRNIEIMSLTEGRCQPQRTQRTQKMAGRSSNFSLWPSRTRHKLKFELRCAVESKAPFLPGEVPDGA